MAVAGSRSSVIPMNLSPCLRTGVAAAALCALVGAGGAVATAAPSASIASEGAGVRITVAVTGSPSLKPVAVITGASVASLSKSGASWRTAVLTGAKATAFQARAGKKVTVRLKAGRRVRNTRVTLVQGAPAGGASPTTPGTPSAGGGSLPGAPTGGLTGQAAIDRFSAYLAGSVMTNISAAANLSSQSTTRFSFCQSGAALVYYRESIGTYTSSTETAQASYRVTQAAFNASGTLGEGLVAYSGAAPGNTSIGSSGQAIIRLGSGIAWINSLDSEYQWQSGVAGC